MEGVARGRWVWLPVAACAAVMLGLSSLPARSMPGSSSLWIYDKLFHAAEYAAFGFLLWRAFALGPSRLSSRLSFAAALAVVAGFGAIDELYQLTSPGRDSSAADWIADVIGGSAGAFTAAMWRHVRAGRTATKG